jgi:Tol biopolymer transport system component
VKRWAIVGVVIAVLLLLVGAVMYVSLWRTSSEPDVVESTKPLPSASHVSDASWSPDGLTILYASYSGIWKIDSDGEKQTYLGEGSCPTWSPDGSQIAFDGENGLEVMEADGSGRRWLADFLEFVPPTTEHWWLETVAWSPDGRIIALEVWAWVPDPSDPSGQSGTQPTLIWTVNADGTGLKRLTADVAYERNPSWSADSQSIVFSSDRNGTWATWTSRVDGSGQPELAESGLLSPDGTRIAYMTEDEDLWLKDADGGNAVEVAGGSAWYQHWAWSPDSTMLAFDSTVVGPVGNIWIVNEDGTGKTRLTRATKDLFDCTPEWIDYGEPQWSPDGTKLLFLNGLTKGNTSWGYDRLWVIELNLEKGLD